MEEVQGHILLIGFIEKIALVTTPGASQTVGLNGPVPFCSRLIFDPSKRHEAWRYLTYMFIHSGVFHAVFNILVQLVLGIPLEMVHGKQV